MTDAELDRELEDLGLDPSNPETDIDIVDIDSII